MSIESYPKPKGEAPNRHKSVEQVEAEDQMRRDIDDFLKSNGVENLPGPVGTVAEYKKVRKEQANLNKTISHKYGSMKLNR